MAGFETIEQRRIRIGNILAKECSNMETREEMFKILKKLDNFILEYPHDVSGYMNRAYILEYLGFYELAMNDLQRAVYLNPKIKAEIYARKSLILLRLGKLENGYASFEWRRGVNFGGMNNLEMDKKIGLPYWNGEKLKKDEKLFVIFEQGIGDVIQFYRFIPYLKEKGIKTVVSLHPVIEKLFSYNLKKLGDWVEIQPNDAEKLNKNCKCNLIK